MHVPNIMSQLFCNIYAIIILINIYFRVSNIFLDFIKILNDFLKIFIKYC